MTVKELRYSLLGVPDDLEVYVMPPEHTNLADRSHIMNIEIVLVKDSLDEVDQVLLIRTTDFNA